MRGVMTEEQARELERFAMEERGLIAEGEVKRLRAVVSWAADRFRELGEEQTAKVLERAMYPAKPPEPVQDR